MVGDYKYKEEKALTETVKKNHKNSYSEMIKVVNMDDANYFNSAKIDSEESLVL